MIGSLTNKTLPNNNWNTGALRAWCAEQMLELTGEADVTLCEVVMDVESNSEAVQCITTNLGSTPAVARFAAEFVNRKLVEQKKGGKKSHAAKKVITATNQQSKTSSSVVQKTAAMPEPDGTGWSVVGSGKQPAAVSGKKGKGKKGTALNSSMLGFDSGSNFKALDLLGNKYN